MAKIEIYETEADVRREAKVDSVRLEMHETNCSWFSSLKVGSYFSLVGALNFISEKTGLAEKMRARKRNISIFPPLSFETTEAIKKYFTPVTLTLGAAFLAIAAFFKLKENALDKQSKALGIGRPHHIIVPDNLSNAAQDEIPMWPIDKPTIHKVPSEPLKKHTERLLKDIDAEPVSANSPNRG